MKLHSTKIASTLALAVVALATAARAQTESPRLVATLEGEIAPNAGDVAFAPGVALGMGGALAVTQPDGAIGLFEPRTGKKIRVLEGFKAAPQKIAFSSDGALLAAALWTRFPKDSPEAQTEAGKDGAGATQIRVWNTVTGQLLQTLDGPNRGVWQLAFWPDSATLTASSVIYEGSAGLTRTGNSTNAVVQQWDWKTGALKKQADGGALAFSPDGQHLARAGGARPTTGPYNTAQSGADVVDTEGKFVPTEGGHSYELKGARFAPDGKTLATLGNNSIKLWDAQSGKLQREIEFAPEGSVFNGSFAFGGRGARLAILGYPNALFDSATGDALGRVTNPAEFKPDGGPSDYALSASGQLLAMLGQIDKAKYGVWVTDLSGLPQLGQPLARSSSDAPGVTTLPSQARALAWKPDGTMLVVGGDTLDFWKPAARVMLRSRPGTDGAGSVAFSPDGQLVLTGARGGNSARLWDASGFELKQVLGTHEWPIEQVAFSPDGKLAVAGGSGFTGSSRAASLGLISVWDVASGKLLKTLTATSDRVRSLAFSPDGKLLANGCYDGAMDVWEVQSFLGNPDPDGGKPLRTLRSGYDSIEFALWSPQGELIGANRRGDIRVWDAATGKIKRELRASAGATRNSLGALAISRSGELLAAGSSGGDGETTEIALIDVQNGAVKRVLKGHAKGIADLSFSPDDKTLASTSEDNSLKIWDLTVQPKP